MPKCSPIHKVTDDARWAAEDLFGRLCIVAHAAFLYAGFHPSSEALDKTAVVLRLYRPWGRNRRGRAHMELRAYAVTASGGGRYMERRERLGPAALEAILSGGVDDTARALRAPPGSAGDGEGLWKLLADRICRGLFVYACDANGVPVMPDFASLPGDVKRAILEKLEDGKDLAVAEAVSKELRNLVAGRDSDLWKAMYEAIVSFCPSYYFRKRPIRDENKNMSRIRWKERY
ncbi:hypothetical protein PVAP13_9NG418900 [Panicum virgatum]|nr:hypothetical protein PVAP13_9NG418900 [Panicum virgatum]